MRAAQKILIDVLALLLSCTPTLKSTAIDFLAEAQRKLIEEMYMQNLMLDTAPPFEDVTWVYDKYDNGTLYRTDDTFIWIPDVTDQDTKYCVYYAGGLGEWILHVDLVEYFSSTYQPNSIYIWFIGSGLNNINRYYQLTADTIRTIAAYTKVIPNHIAVTGSSAGGYSALLCASHIYKDLGIYVDKILIFDQGMDWDADYYMPNEEEMRDLLYSGAKVYAFEQEGDMFTLAGALQFANYGVPVIEVACRECGHDEMSVQAFMREPFLWAVGLADKLDPEEYYLIRGVNCAV